MVISSHHENLSLNFVNDWSQTVRICCCCSVKNILTICGVWVWSIDITSWKMIYCHALPLHYIVCTKQPAYGVATPLMLLGIFSWRIHLTLCFNSLWQAWKRVLCCSLKAMEAKFSRDALWKIDCIWAATRYLFRVLIGRQLDSVPSQVTRRPLFALMNWQTFRAWVLNANSTCGPRGWNNKIGGQVGFLYLVHLTVKCHQSCAATYCLPCPSPSF